MNIKKQVSLNRDIRGLSQSATLAINDQSKKLLTKGKVVHRPGLGQSPFPVPTPAFNTLRLHALEEDYLPAHGLPELREAVTEFHRRKGGVDVDSEYMGVLPGVSFGRPANELTARPAYVNFDGAGALTVSEPIPLEQPLPQDFTDTRCHKVIAATQLVSEWARKHAVWE